ncbi:hypothetical protein WN943_027491 [Citrus x changshan-huyou]
MLLKSKSSSRDEESVSLLSSGDSKRCVSTVTSEYASSSEIRAHKLRIIAVVARCHEVKLKFCSETLQLVNIKSGSN